MHLHCAGSGPTSVVLIAGFTDDRTTFGSVEASLWGTSRVCSYDRFGTGTSDAPSTAQTFATQAGDLHQLLTSANEPGPYVVVGHSFGGDVAISFASMFPDDVRGLLLLDTPPAAWNSAICAVEDDGSAAVADFVAACRMQSESANNIEGIDGPATFVRLAGIASLGDVPMIVDTAGPHDYAANAMNPDTAARLSEAWNTGQQHWASLSTAAQLVQVDGSGHYIHIDRPDLVLAQVAELNS
jgi:pimeloyl-ACP methyl ester carboxylesterase